MSSLEPTILLVEGKGAQSQSLQHFLAKEWQCILIAHTSSSALATAKTNQPHIVVFDASTTRSNGARTCLRLRKQHADTPLVYCQQIDAETPEDLAADVILKRPFTARKLINRVRMLLPAKDDASQILSSTNLTLYMGKKSVSVNGTEHALNPKLALLLELFMRQAGQVVSRKELMEHVWKTSYVGDTRTLDVHIRWIRKIIEENPKKPTKLTTVRGVGYIFQDSGAAS